MYLVLVFYLSEESQEIYWQENKNALCIELLLSV
jgi:hypothetical protein